MLELRHKKEILHQNSVTFFYFNKYKKHLIDLVPGVLFFPLLVDQESEQRGVELGFGRHVGLLPQPEDPLRRREEQTLPIWVELNNKHEQCSPPYLMSPDLHVCFMRAELTS